MAAKKTTATRSEKKAAPEKPASKASAARPMAKSAVSKEVAGRTGLEPKQVSAVLEALSELAREELGRKGPGVFVLAGMVKLKRVKTPARKAGKRPNPFKPGETMTVKARPASVKVKPVVLKGLKEVAGGQ